MRTTIMVAVLIKTQK